MLFTINKVLPSKSLKTELLNQKKGKKCAWFDDFFIHSAATAAICKGNGNSNRAASFNVVTIAFLVHTTTQYSCITTFVSKIPFSSIACAFLSHLLLSLVGAKN